MKILITGKNSFIGSNFIKHSEFDNIEEACLVASKPEDIDYTPYDVVLHLAAIVHQSKKIPEHLYYEINRDLAVRTALSAKKSGVKHFIFLSTLKVYGDSADQGEKRNENSDCLPSDPYGKSKYEAEKALSTLSDHDFTVSIIRSSVVYGDGVKANIYNLIRLADRFPVLPFGNIQNRRNFVYVENLIAYIAGIIKKRKPGIFIAIDDKPMSTTELVSLILENLGKKVFLPRLPKPVVKAGYLFLPSIFSRLYGSLEFDNTATLRNLDFKIPYSVEEGIKRTIMAYKRQKSALNHI